MSIGLIVTFLSLISVIPFSSNAQCSINTSIPSGEVSYDTEVVFKNDGSDTIYYELNGNPVSSSSSWFLDSIVVRLPVPDEHNPLVSVQRMVVETADQLLLQSESLMYSDSIINALDSVYKIGYIEFLTASGCRWSYIYVDPNSFLRHLNADIIQLDFAFEDLFGNDGIAVIGEDCLYPEAFTSDTIRLVLSLDDFDSVVISDTTWEFYDSNLPYFVVDGIYVHLIDSSVVIEFFEDLFQQHILNDYSSQGDYFEFEFVIEAYCPSNFAFDMENIVQQLGLPKSLVERAGRFRHITSNGEIRHDTEADISLAGQFTRYFPAKRFKVDFTPENRIRYDLFGNGIEKYDKLILRKSGTFSTGIPTGTFVIGLPNDLFANKLMLDESLGAQDGKLVVLYLRNEFFGYYYLREKEGKHLIEAQTGIDRNDISRFHFTGNSIISMDLPLDTIHPTQMKFEKFVDSLSSIDDLNLAGYKHWINQHLETHSFFKWVIISAALGRTDNNGNDTRLYHEEDRILKTVMRDFDASLFNPMYNHFNDMPNIISVLPANLLIKFLENDSLRWDYINLSADLLTEKLTSNYLLDLYMTIVNHTLPHITNNFLRWGHYKTVIEPDSNDFVNIELPYPTHFLHNRPNNIISFFKEDHKVDTVSIWMQVVVVDEQCPGNSAFLKLSNIIAKDTSWVRRLTFTRESNLDDDIHVPLYFEHENFIHLKINDSIITEPPSHLIFDPDSTYFIQAFYRCQEILHGQDELIINEIVAANDSVINDEFGEYEDYIEIFNTSVDTVSMEGVFISDNPDNLFKHQLENIIIPPLDYTILWADNEENQGSYHLNFKLDKDGENVILSFANGTEINSIVWEFELETDQAFGFCPTDNLPQIMEPSPLEDNNCPVSIQINELKGLRIYPKPITSHFLYIDGVLDGVINEVSIFNSMGKKVLAQSFGDVKTLKVDLPNLHNGIYFLVIQTSTGNAYSYMLIKV